MTALYRPVELTREDAELLAELMTRANPDEPEDPVVQLHALFNPTPGYARERFVLEIEGQSVGVARHGHPLKATPDSYAGSRVALVPEARSVAALVHAYGFLETRVRAAGVRTLTTHVLEDDDDQRLALEQCGWTKDRVSKVWELDLVAGRERILAMAAETREAAARLGIRCLPLAAETDPQRYEKIHDMGERAAQDIPTTLPIPRGELAEFMAQLASPDLSEDRFWIAKDGDRYAGLSHLRYPPVRGNVWTGYTATAPEYRGRGIAKAVKMETLVQAIELGITRVRTDNDSENAPMLHINEQLGYTSLPALASYLKRLE